MKVLVLIIASDNEERYVELQKLWKVYMHSDPEHFEAYFIRGNPDLPTLCQTEEDVVWSRTRECVIPGILIKTVYSLEYFLPRIKEFDFVIRTNLSSFYIFPRLLDYLGTLPKQRCYIGPSMRVEGGGAVSGCGIIFSSDLAELIVREKELCLSLKFSDYDDVVLGRLLHIFRAFPSYSPYFLVSTQEAVEMFKEDGLKNVFHIRVGNPFFYAHLVQMFYPAHG